jgi:hypothetical protein
MLYVRVEFRVTCIHCAGTWCDLRATYRPWPLIDPIAGAVCPRVAFVASRISNTARIAFGIIPAFFNHDDDPTHEITIVRNCAIILTACGVRQSMLRRLLHEMFVRHKSGYVGYMSVGRVVDKTGPPGAYDFTLEFAGQSAR